MKHKKFEFPGKLAQGLQSSEPFPASLAGWKTLSLANWQIFRTAGVIVQLNGHRKLPVVFTV
jgi:hypothetical protein